MARVMVDRTAQQVTARLDALIGKIHEIQGPYMHGEKAVDIVLVRSSWEGCLCWVGTKSMGPVRSHTDTYFVLSPSAG